MHPAIALTIGGSDSGGGAGIQADLKTFLALQVHGCSAISCITAQNTCGVSRVDGLPPEALTAQIESVLADLPVAAIKTGMLLNAALITAAADAPTRRGRVQVEAMPGWMPSLTKVMPNLASRCTTRRSAPSAKQKPAPMACP